MPPVVREDGSIDWIEYANQRRQGRERFVSEDGQVTFDRGGRRLDFFGNTARETSQGRQSRRQDELAGQAVPGGLPGAVPLAPAPPLSAVTGLPLPTPGLQPVGLNPAGAPYVGPAFTAPGAALFPNPDLNDAQFQRLLAYNNSVVQPTLQFLESQRRFDTEFPARQRVDAFNVAGRARLPSPRFISVA